MTKKQYRRKLDYIEGYKRAYHNWKGIKYSVLITKSTDYRRGYMEGRKDFRTREPALY